MGKKMFSKDDGAFLDDDGIYHEVKTIALEDLEKNPHFYFDWMKRTGRRIAVMDEGRIINVLAPLDQTRILYGLIHDYPEDLAQMIRRRSDESSIDLGTFKAMFEKVSDEVEELLEQRQHQGRPEAMELGVALCSPGARQVPLPPDIAFKLLVRLYDILRTDLTRNMR